MQLSLDTAYGAGGAFVGSLPGTPGAECPGLFGAFSLYYSFHSVVFPQYQLRLH